MSFLDRYRHFVEAAERFAVWSDPDRFFRWLQRRAAKCAFCVNGKVSGLVPGSVVPCPKCRGWAKR